MMTNLRQVVIALLGILRGWPVWLALAIVIGVIVLSIQGCPGPGIK